MKVHLKSVITDTIFLRKGFLITAFLQVPEAAYPQQHEPVQRPGQWLIVSHFLFGEGSGNDANNNGDFTYLLKL